VEDDVGPKVDIRESTDLEGEIPSPLEVMELKLVRKRMREVAGGEAQELREKLSSC